MLPAEPQHVLGDSAEGIRLDDAPEVGPVGRVAAVQDVVDGGRDETRAVAEMAVLHGSLLVYQLAAAVSGLAATGVVVCLVEAFPSSTRYAPAP